MEKEAEINDWLAMMAVIIATINIGQYNSFA